MPPVAQNLTSVENLISHCVEAIEKNDALECFKGLLLLQAALNNAKPSSKRGMILWTGSKKPVLFSKKAFEVYSKMCSYLESCLNVTDIDLKL